MTLNDIQYITDADGREVGVILPIELWREIASEREVAELLDGVAPADSSSRDFNGNEGASATYIGTDEVTGLPVFITPPGSPTLTSEHVKMLEEEW
jgi:hypothetical protein